MESWEKDLNTYPDHFRRAVRDALGEPEPTSQKEETPEVELFYSDIRPIPAELQIQSYLEQITPPDAHKHKFKFESVILGIVIGVVVFGIFIIMVVLGSAGLGV